MLLEEKEPQPRDELEHSEKFMNFVKPTIQLAPRPMRASGYCANLKRHFSDLGQDNWQGRSFSSILENRIR